VKCYSHAAWYDFCCFVYFLPYFIASVIAAFEKNEFFDSFVTKEMFFLTLHDALLAALAKHQKPDERELTTEENAEKLRAKDEMVEYLAYM